MQQKKTLSTCFDSCLRFSNATLYYDVLNEGIKDGYFIDQVLRCENNPTNVADLVFMILAIIWIVVLSIFIYTVSRNENTDKPKVS